MELFAKQGESSSLTPFIINRSFKIYGDLWPLSRNSELFNNLGKAPRYVMIDIPPHLLKDLPNVWKYLNNKGEGLLLNMELVRLFKMKDLDLLEFLHGRAPIGSEGNIYFAYGGGAIVKESDHRVADEGEISFIAGETGIAPYVYLTKRVKDKEYILMQKIDGPTLNKKYPYQVEDIIGAIEKYHTLLEWKGIAQSDLKGENIMFNEDNRLYLIDYDIAVENFKGDVGKHMVKMVDFLIESLTTRGNSYNADDFWNDTDSKRMSDVFISIETAANRWITEHYPGNHLNVRFSEHLFRDKNGQLTPEMQVWIKENTARRVPR